jgi:hypothetical protein
VIAAAIIANRKNMGQEAAQAHIVDNNDLPRLVEGERHCPKCNGKRKLFELDIARARSVRKTCPKCNGTGIDPASIRDGVRCFQLKCQVVVYSKCIDGTDVASLHLWIFPLMRAGKPILTPAGHMMLHVMIPQMHTKPKYRRQGHMAELLKIALTDVRVAVVESSYGDSTESGRAFLVAAGFKHEGNKLIWRRWGELEPERTDQAEVSGVAGAVQPEDDPPKPESV